MPSVPAFDSPAQLTRQVSDPPALSLVTAQSRPYFHKTQTSLEQSPLKSFEITQLKQHWNKRKAVFSGCKFSTLVLYKFMSFNK